MTSIPARLRLRELAHARSGDKGSGANIAVIANGEREYRWLRDHLTAERVEAYFASFGTRGVVRYELPNLGAFNFVLPRILAPPGSRSIRIDAQGKGLGQALLELELPVTEADLAALGRARN